MAGLGFGDSSAGTFPVITISQRRAADTRMMMAQTIMMTVQIELT